jgi:histone-lysine N-methyltransferase SETDB1
MNRHRYLIFFDDGYASYIRHDDLRVVCKQSPNVWEDVHANSRDFISKYLMQYPERPMVKLTVEQVVRTEWEGSWWFTKVEEVDASLVRLLFHVNNHREWVYRGSTRLGPLYLEMQEQKKRNESGMRTISRRNTAFNRNKPYVEYTRQTDEEQSGNGGPNADSQIKRAVARKSTTAAKKTDVTPSEPRERWESKGKVNPVDLTGRVEGKVDWKLSLTKIMSYNSDFIQRIVWMNLYFLEMFF